MQRRFSVKNVKRLGRYWQLYLLLLPTIAYFLVFNYAPMYGVTIAFKKFMPRLGIIGSPWVGLQYFAEFFESYYFSMLIRNTVLLNVYSLLFSFPLPILLALMLNEMRSKRYKKVIQTVTYAPHFISTVVMVSMITLFLSPETGIINMLLGKFGVTPQNYMGQTSAFRTIYITSGAWQETGWSAVVYLAALAGVDYELHEAATIDGASRLQRIWHINLPSITPTISILLIFALSGIMGMGFEKIFLMQNPLNTEVSEVISTYVYKRGLQSAQYSFSTAVGLFNSVINFILLILVNKAMKAMGAGGLF